MQEKKVLFKGRPLHYSVSGSGMAVMLVHGFGEGPEVWRLQLNSLKGYKLILPSLPGTGLSELQDDMSMEGMAMALKAIFDAELASEEKLVMIGHSMGGYITLAFAATYPSLLSGFGLFHSTAYADTEEKKETRRKGIEFIKTNGGEAFLKTTIPNLYGPATKEGNKSLIDQHITSSRNFSDAALVMYYESMIKRPDRTEVLKKAKIPVLMVLGRHDAAVPFKDSLEQTSMPDLSYIHILESSGHMGMVEEPEKASTVLKQYLDDLTKKGQPE